MQQHNFNRHYSQYQNQPSSVFRPTVFRPAHNPPARIPPARIQPARIQPAHNPPAHNPPARIQPVQNPPVRYSVIPNNGQDDRMYNQCMWISHRDFLQRHGFPHITTRQIRAVAGLDSSTENMSFDIMKPEFASALFRVANYFNLQIVVVVYSFIKRAS